MLESLTKTDLYLSMIINGVFTGFAVAIGSYLANKHFIERIKRLMKKINEKLN